LRAFAGQAFSWNWRSKWNRNLDVLGQGTEIVARPADEIHRLERSHRESRSRKAWVPLFEIGPADVENQVMSGLIRIHAKAERGGPVEEFEDGQLMKFFNLKRFRNRYGWVAGCTADSGVAAAEPGCEESGLSDEAWEGTVIPDSDGRIWNISRRGSFEQSWFVRKEIQKVRDVGPYDAFGYQANMPPQQLYRTAIQH